MYTEASSPRVPGDKFLMQIGPFVNYQSLCFSFWYHMYGSAMGTLQLKDNNTVLLSYSGNQGISWRKASVTLRSDVHLVR